MAIFKECGCDLRWKCYKHFYEEYSQDPHRHDVVSSIFAFTKNKTKDMCEHGYHHTLKFYHSDGWNDCYSCEFCNQIINLGEIKDNSATVMLKRIIEDLQKKLARATNDKK